MSTAIALKRRSFLLGSAAIGAAAATPSAASACPTSAESASYEITMTDAEWREHLGQEAYEIMRAGGTEFPFTSPYWETNERGMYHCKGCDLALYHSDHYSAQPMGFVFFRHAMPDAVLTGIDVTDYNGMLPEPKEFVEVHCRRCGGHLGHMISKEGEILHCINGTALQHKEIMT